MLNLQRTLHPVGHGAFFTEKFYDNHDDCFTVVYDCGSQDSLLIKNAINNYFNNNETKVDVLFISHFDSDHVNGLSELKQYFKSDTKVFIPYYHPNLLRVYPSEMSRAIYYINEELGGKWQIIMVTNNFNNDINERIIDIDEIDTPSVESGTKLRKRIADEPIWEYVPFNLFNDNKIIEKIKNFGININQPNEWDKDTIKRIRGHFKDKSLNQGHSINENSLILLSHATCGDIIKAAFYDRAQRHHCYHIHPYHATCCSCLNDMITAALYTGDSVLKASSVLNPKVLKGYDEFLLMLQKKYAKYISLFQIPHHGSSSNSNLTTLLDAMMLRLFVNCSDRDLNRKSFILNNNHLEERLHKPIYKVTNQQYQETFLIY